MSDVSEDTAGGSLPKGQAWLANGSVAVATVVTFVVRLLLYGPLREPLLFHDEAGYLFSAIHLAGISPQPTMLVAPLYNPGYSLLIAPIMLVAQHPETRYALTLGANALFGALVVPAAFLVARQIFSASRSTAVIAAILVAIYPAQSISGSIAWADAVIPLATLSMVLVVSWVTTRCTYPAAVATGALGAYLYLIHPRLIVHGLLLMGLAAVLMRRGRCRRGVAVAIVLTYGVGFGLSQMLIASVRDSVWTGVAATTGFVRRLVTPGGAVDFVRNSVGEAWYLLVATFGLAAVGGIYITLSLLRHRRLSASNSPEGIAEEPRNLIIAYIFSLTIGSYVLSAAFLIGELDRVDKLFYGRYNESFLPLLLIAAVVYLNRSGTAWRAWLIGIAGIVVTGAAFAARYPMAGIPPGVPLNPFLVSALEGWRHLVGVWEVPAISLAVVIVGVVAAVASMRSPSVALVIVALTWMLVTSFAWSVWRYGVSDGVARFYTIDDFLVSNGIPPSLAYQNGEEYLYDLYAYQWALPDTQFVVDTDAALETSGPQCILSSGSGPGPGWSLVLAEPESEASLWTRGTPTGSGVCRD